jgi:hypothetical protein
MRVPGEPLLLRDDAECDFCMELRMLVDEGDSDEDSPDSAEDEG